MKWVLTLIILLIMTSVATAQCGPNCQCGCAITGVCICGQQARPVVRQPAKPRPVAYRTYTYLRVVRNVGYRPVYQVPVAPSQRYAVRYDYTGYPAYPYPYAVQRPAYGYPTSSFAPMPVSGGCSH